MQRDTWWLEGRKSPDSQRFSGLNINHNESEGERSGRRVRPRPARRLWAGIHHTGGGFGC